MAGLPRSLTQTGKSVDRLVVCDDASSGHVAKGTMFTRNGRYLFLSWRRYGNGYRGYQMSVYQ